MKKNVCIVSVALIGLLTTACSNEDYPVQEETVQTQLECSDDEQELERIASQINDLGIQYTSGKSEYIDAMTRLGPISHSKGKKVVVVADAVGALVGGVKGFVSGGWVGGVVGALWYGAKASIKAVGTITAWNYITEKPVKNNAMSSNYLVISSGLTNPSFMMSADSIGYIHNDIAYEIFKNYENYSHFMNLSNSGKHQMVDSIIISKYPNFQDSLTVADPHLSHTIIELDPYDSSYNVVLHDMGRAIETYDNLSDFCDYLKSSLNVATGEMDILHAYVRLASDLETNDDLYDFTLNTLTSIVQSSIASDTKERLVLAVITGYASMHLWDDDAFSALE